MHIWKQPLLSPKNRGGERNIEDQKYCVEVYIYTPTHVY